MLHDICTNKMRNINSKANKLSGITPPLGRRPGNRNDRIIQADSTSAVMMNDDEFAKYTQGQSRVPAAGVERVVASKTIRELPESADNFIPTHSAKSRTPSGNANIAKIASAGVIRKSKHTRTAEPKVTASTTKKSSVPINFMMNNNLLAVFDYEDFNALVGHGMIAEYAHLGKTKAIKFEKDWSVYRKLISKMGLSNIGLVTKGIMRH